MDEYISKKDVENLLGNTIAEWEILRKIDELPSVDIPEIITCEHCKNYYFADNRVPSEQAWVCDLDGKEPPKDWYCAGAERREEDGSNEED